MTTLLFTAGMLLVGVATLGRLWCSLYVAGRKKKELVSEGPYSLSRHPLYFFSLVGFLGVGLCSETLLIPVLLLLAFALYYPHVMRHEETTLRELHGTAFDEYVAATPYFFPRLTGMREPETYVVDVRRFRARMFDALLFVWCVGLLELLEELHKLGWLPTLFTVY